jgi:multicomponent Na+:H+ antiporter subunit C
MTTLSYSVAIILMTMGLWAMLSKKNLIKKLMGLAIFQTGIILFFISMGAKEGATIPILDHHGYGGIYSDDYANPLTQILMLTAIVVGVATLGLGLALARKIYAHYGSFNEDDILANLREPNE